MNPAAIKAYVANASNIIGACRSCRPVYSRMMLKEPMTALCVDSLKSTKTGSEKTNMPKSNLDRPPLNIYGPVPSRRLGFSLGVDIIPFKTCTLDCIYCQLGPSSRKTVRRGAFLSQEEIIRQLKDIVKSGVPIDYITFSGSGEPTLNTILGDLIKEIKKFTKIPVAVLTNATLLSRQEVRAALQEADLVVPSLDASTQSVFNKINRPHPTLKVEKIIKGLKIFRQEFKGSIWLEVMLVKGINDSPAHIQKLKKVLHEINPDKVQLNTVIRPPAESYALPLNHVELEKIKATLAFPQTEIIAEFNKKARLTPEENLESVIFALVKRRPVTLSDMASVLGKHRNELIKYLNFLLKQEKIKTVRHKGRQYYESI